MEKHITLKDLADHLQVSQNTVSVALRGGKSVSKATRELVLKTAHEMGYTGKSRAKLRMLIAGTFDNISDNYFFSYLQSSALREIAVIGAEAVHLHLHPAITAREIERVVLDNHVSGVIIIGDTSREICGYFALLEIPVVTVGFQYHDLPFSAVNEDNFMGIQLVLEHLIQRGYHDIGFIGNPQSSYGFFERYVFVQALLPTYGLSFSPDYCVCDDSSDIKFDSSKLYQALSRMRHMPEAFVCADDRVAVFALKTLQSMGHSCPRDIALISFDNNEISSLSTPTLTTVETELAQQGVSAVSLLVRKINEQESYAEKIVLPVRLIERESVGNIRRR